MYSSLRYRLFAIGIVGGIIGGAIYWAGKGLGKW